ncbi:Thiamine pyrophosphokinase [Urinicoccus massiliensis]|uniref:Thiamine diphosphokinase n=1 Tax=Urinicoccus massiliensis TaxID=1723382 RepID=A0A8H2M4C4_9FIRM|nr:thiamine diphosphokinase [Urinicoccus massiliensis]VFB16234.1 Thiamine pyrophosphokinase [Urinicoccus massiliensis]
MKVAIVSGGQAPPKEFLQQYRDWYIIAADSGVHCLLEAGIDPQQVIGDLDSIDSQDLKILEDKGIKIKSFPKEKDETDTHLCLLEAIRLQAESIHILACFGRRFDQTLAHLALLEIAHDYKITCSLVDQENKVEFLSPGKYQVSKDGYQYLSLVPVTESITVSLYHMKYPLERENLYRKKSQGISNEILDQEGTIKLHKGKAYLIHSNDKKR